MFTPKILLIAGLCMSFGVLAAPQQRCMAHFLRFVVDRVPGGYPVNKATLTVTGTGACTQKDGTTSGQNSEINIKHTVVDVYDEVTHRHKKVQTTTVVDIDMTHKLARVFNSYLGLSIELPFKIRGNRITIQATSSPRKVFGPGAPPYYNVREGSVIMIEL